MIKIRNKIDTRTPPHLRLRPAHWDADCFSREYFSWIIPKFYTDVSKDMESKDMESKDMESKVTLHVKRWLIENDRLLKEQREEVSPVISMTRSDQRQAAIDARVDMRDIDKQEKIDRREAAVAAGTCDAEYTGRCKNDCRGDGTSGACNKCSGQLIKAGGTEYTKQKSRHVDSEGARQPRQRGDYLSR